MQKIFKSVFVVFAVITGISIASIPVRTHAKQTNSNAVGVAVNVAPVLTLTVNTATINVGSIAVGSVATGSFTTTVTSNQTYTLSIAGNGSNNMRLDGAGSYNATNQIPGSGTVTAGSTGWGVRRHSVGGAFQNIVSAPAPIYTSTASSVTNENVEFDVGVAAGPGIVSGSYTGSLTITAANI